MDLTAYSVSGDLPSTSPALRSSRLSLQHSHRHFGPNQKTVVTPGAWKTKNSLRIRPAVNKLKSDISKGSNEAIGPDTVFKECVFEKSRELEEMVSKEHSLSENDQIGMNLVLLESDLQAALSSLKKKEEDLEDAERKVLYEQDKLDQTKHELERREEDRSAALDEQKRMEEGLNNANSSIASQLRQTKDLKLLVKDLSKKVARSQHALSVKEDELSKRTDDFRKKDKEVEIMSSELESKKLLLDEAREVIRKQEEKLVELQMEVADKERGLAESLQLTRAEQERLKIREAELEKQTVEWLSAREELKALAELASAQINDVNGTSEDFKRVRALLSVLKQELVAAQKALSSSQKNTEEHTLLLKEKAEELEEQKLLVTAYMNSLKDAELEVESEGTKLRDAAALFDGLKSQTSDARKLILHLEEEVYKERATLEQHTREMTSLRKELQQKELDYSDAHKRIQAKESELVEARLRIQQMEAEQASMQLVLQEKDADVLQAQKALSEAQADIAGIQIQVSRWEAREIGREKMKQEMSEDVDGLEKLCSLRQERFTGKLELEAATRAMREIQDLTRQLVEMTRASARMDDQGVDASVEVAEREITRLLGLTEELVKEAGITVTADTSA